MPLHKARMRGSAWIFQERSSEGQVGLWVWTLGDLHIVLPWLFFPHEWRNGPSPELLQKYHLKDPNGILQEVN